MKKNDMTEVVEFIKRIVVKKERPEKIREEVIAFGKNFQTVHYCFESANKAYEFIKLRLQGRFKNELRKHGKNTKNITRLSSSSFCKDVIVDFLL
jgi:hypothetical protein